MLEKVKELGSKIKTRGKLSIGGATAALGAGTALAVSAFADDTPAATFSVPLISNSVTSDMMNGIMEQITSLLPIVLPVLVGVLAFRKGLSFFIGMIRGL